jgi:hypothetical protein
LHSIDYAIGHESDDVFSIDAEIAPYSACELSPFGAAQVEIFVECVLPPLERPSSLTAIWPLGDSESIESFI